MQGNNGFSYLFACFFVSMYIVSIPYKKYYQFRFLFLRKKNISRCFVSSFIIIHITIVYTLIYFYRKCVTHFQIQIKPNVEEGNSCRFQGQVKSIKMSFMVISSSQLYLEEENKGIIVDIFCVWKSKFSNQSSIEKQKNRETC